MSVPIAKYFALMPYLSGIFKIIYDVEAIHGAGTGPTKRKAAIAAIVDVIETVEPAIVQNNPELHDELGKVVDEIVGLLNAWAAKISDATPSQPNVPQEPPQPPPPQQTPPPAPPAVFTDYGKPLASRPADSALQNGDRIYFSTSLNQYWVGYAALGTQAPFGGDWVLIATVTKA